METMARRMPSAPTHHLARVPLFARLPAAVLDDLARSSRVRQYPPGQILCNEGDAGDHLIVLEVGHLRISRFTTIGDEAVLAVIAVPAVGGELALTDGPAAEPRRARRRTGRHPLDAEPRVP